MNAGYLIQYQLHMLFYKSRLNKGKLKMDLYKTNTCSLSVDDHNSSGTAHEDIMEATV